MINWKKPAKISDSSQITKLKTKITQLEKQNAQLRLFLTEIINLAYQAVNSQTQSTENSSEEKKEVKHE